MAIPDQVVTSVDLADLNSVFRIVSDRQLAREEAHKVIAVYVALHPEAATKRDTEYRVHFPSRLIPGGTEFSPEAFTALRAEAPAPRESSAGGCAGVVVLGILGAWPLYHCLG